jgi:hypothetical protein
MTTSDSLIGTGGQKLKRAENENARNGTSMTLIVG